MELVAHDFGIDAWHVIRLPCENIDVFLQELHHMLLLFWGKQAAEEEILFLISFFYHCFLQILRDPAFGPPSCWDVNGLPQL